MNLVVNFDSSVSNAPAGFEAAINYVVNLYDQLFTNNVTVTINVGWGEFGGTTITDPNAAAKSSAISQSYSYAKVSQALIDNAQTTAQQAADATLPSVSGSPFGTGNSIRVSNAEAKALGLIANNTNVDGSIGFNANLNWSLDPNSTPSGEHDLIAAAEHEISEIMGRIASVGTSSEYRVMDFYRYSAPGVRDLAPGAAGSGATAYFSYDNGNTDLGTWNNDPSGGDFGDWRGGLAPGPQGADAYGSNPSGYTERLTMTDVTLMNLMGWSTYDLPSAANGGGTTVANGLTDWVPAGQTHDEVLVLSGGFQEVAGMTDDSMVESGATLELDSGGHTTGTKLAGIENVRNGGTVYDTVVDSGGEELVKSGGTAIDAVLYSGGTQYVYSGGTTSYTQFAGGTQSVLSGATVVSADVVSGQQLVQSAGTAIDTVVESGSVQYVSSGGVASGTIVETGGVQSVESGGTASDTLVNGAGDQYVYMGGTASNTTADFGNQIVYGAAAGTTLSGSFATEFVYGAVAAVTLDNGSYEYVESGGADSGTVINSGALDLIYLGGTASGAVVESGGEQDVLGLVSGTIIDSGGYQHVYSGGTADGTTLNSGGLLQLDVGASLGSAVAFGSPGGTLRIEGVAMPQSAIDGFAMGDTIDLAGVSYDSNGTATLGAGNVLTVSAGGQTYDLNLDPTQDFAGDGFVLSSGTFAETEVLLIQQASGSAVTVSAGETEFDVLVGSGGSVDVLSGGTVSGATVSSGGTLDVFDGGTLTGNVDNDGMVNFNIAGSATFSGTLTGTGTLTVSGGGDLDVLSSYTGTAEVDDNSTLEFTGAYTGAATFSGAATGPGGTLKFDAGSVGPITVANPNDTVIAQPGSDNWIQSTVDYTLPTNIDTLFLYGGTQGTGNGDAVGDALYALDAGNAQTLTGNSLNDTFVVYNTSDVVTPMAGSHDVVYAAASYTLPTGVDVLIMESGTQGVGNSDATGDALYAANPNQTATLTGNSANDTFVVYNSSDVVVPMAGSHDVVYTAVDYTLPTGVDSLILEGPATQGIGNSDATGDTLYAANPNQVATLTGNSLNDTFVVYNSADTVVGQANSTDTVYTAASFALPSNVDTLFLEGSNATLGTGNGDAFNALFGNAGFASTLVAGSGTDTLAVTGAAGTTLTGGAGADTFAFPNAMGHDEVTNFGTAKDMLQFSASLFANFAAAMTDATQSGPNTLFSIDANNSVTLDNVNRSGLTASNFHFT